MQRNDYGTTTGSSSSSQITITARSLRNLSESRAEIERLEKEVERLRGVLRKRTEEADEVSAVISAASAIRALKRPTP